MLMKVKTNIKAGKTLSEGEEVVYDRPKPNP